MAIPQIRSASESERQRVVQAIVLGFVSDPLARWFWPQAGQYLDAMPALIEAFGGRAFDTDSAYTTQRCEGAALWLPPGTEPDEETMGAILESTTDPAIRDDVMGVLQGMDEYHPHDVPCWYLPLIAVDPAYQGQGFGSALMKHALQRCDEDGVTAYLESSNPRNMSLYERHGFETVGRIQVGASPPVHAMIRAP